MIRRAYINRDGFTLIEALLATLILAVALIALVAAFYGVTAFITEVKELSIATLAVERQIELIRNMTFDSILALGSSFTFTVTGLNSATGQGEIDNPYTTTNMRRVSVTVSWTSRSGKSFSKSLVTLVTRNGIRKE